MTKTKGKAKEREKYGRVEISSKAQAKLGAVAALARENIPDVIDRVCIPALDAELKRQAASAKSK
jgi:hypothetical protein